MRSQGRLGENADEAVLRLVQSHAAELLRFARRFSYCADDAHDAYQRTLEILIRRMRTDPPEQPLRWARTVLRHEALAVRAQRERWVGRAELDLDRHEDRQVADPAERVVGYERLSHTAEALQRLKPQEVTALVLRAEGLSYKEICARTGWTYTRCNRTVNEGRRALRDRLGAIESGGECARWLPLLSALADGEATRKDLAALRPHLRACAACRATLRDFHAAPAQVAALVPAALLPLAASDPSASLAGQLELAVHALAERASLVAMRVQGAFEAASGTKLAAVAASTAALAGGGAAIEHATQERPASRPPARVAAASSPASSPSLVPASAVLPRTVGGAGRPSHGSRPPEFAPPPASTPEFASGSSSAPAPGRITATVATSPPPTESPQFGPSSTSPAEFAGP